MKNTVTMYKFHPGYYISSSNKLYYITIDSIEDGKLIINNESYPTHIENIDDNTYTHYIEYQFDKYEAIDEIEDISLLENALSCTAYKRYESRVRELVEEYLVDYNKS